MMCRQLRFSVVSLILGALAAACFVLQTSSVSAQSELPVLVKAPTNAKVMLIVDDSGSMNAVIEHANFDKTASCVTDSTHTLPSVIFRLQSGSAAPATSQQLTPVLIELNGGFYSSSQTGNLYASQSLSNANSGNLPLTNAMNCNTTSSTSSSCCTGSGSGCTKTGINTGALYSDSTVQGASVFQISSLAKVGATSTNVTDSSGNEYIYMKYRKNNYEAGGENWNDVWGEFDSSGNLLDNYTTPFATTGGTVVFNGVEVFLSAGWYRKEYLTWIFYCATPAERAALPGVSRLSSVKDVLEDLINNNTSVSFGLATLNGSGFSAGTHSGYMDSQWYTPDGDASTCSKGQIRKTIGTAASSLISELATLTPRGGTPLTATYTEALRYFGAAADSDSCTSSNSAYTSPITAQCDAHSIVLLTDGLPTSESARKLPNGSYISNLDGVSNPVGTNSSCSNSDCLATFLPDASWYGYHSDLRSTIAGTQNIVSYSIAFGVSRYPLLDRFAETGGSGAAYAASNSSELDDVLTEIVGNIFNTPTSGAGVATLEKIYGETKVYQPIFYADTWVGQIQVFNYNQETEELDYSYNMADVLESRNLSSSPRNIIAGLDTDGDGKTNSTIALTASNASTLRPRLFQFYDSGALSSSLLPSPISAYTTTTAAQTLISYIQGNAVSGLRTRDRDADGLVDRIGDIVYSKPVEVGQKNGNLNWMQGYTNFIAGLQSEPAILLVGANDGMMHAFNSATGDELWAYIPSSQVPYLERLARPTYNTSYRRSYVDGPITVEDVYINGAWRTIAMFGLRTGGSTYTVLDITDRDNPSLLWEVSDSAVYGQSWSKPVLVISGNTSGSATPSSYSWYMVVGTGEGRTSAGTVLGVYNLNNTSPPTPTSVTISSSDAAGTRTTAVTTAQTDADGNVDRLYLGTELGDLYRVHVTGTGPSSWVVQKLFDGGTTQPIVAAPLVVLADNPQYTGGSGVSGVQLAVGVYFGTGRHDQTSDITSVAGTSQSIYGIFDPVDTATDSYTNVLTNQTRSNFQNQSVSSFSVRRDSSTGKYYIPTGKSGFYIDLSTSINLTSSNYLDPVGEVVYPPINLRGALLFTTFLPDNGSCDIGGFGFLEAVNYQTGGGIIVDSVSNPKRSFYNGGIPDINGSGSINSSDLTAGITAGKILPVVDAQVQSVDLTDDVTPYEHDGVLASADVRLHATNGGIIPAVSSIGHTGLPSSPALLIGEQKILMQDAYPSDPSTPGGGSGGSGDSDAGEVGSTNQMPPPKLAPINIYQLPVKLLSFHEVTDP